MYNDQQMNPAYKEVFDEHITSVVRGISVITYDPITGDSGKLFHPFSHGISPDGSRRLGEALRNYLVFYAYDEAEIVTKHLKGQLADLDVAAKLALERRIPERHGSTNGLYSEALLHLILELMYDNIKRANLRTVYRQPDDNSEIRGFDSAHLILDGNEKHLYLGQAKLGAKTYCVSSIREDLEKISFIYTYKQLVFIADKTGYIPSDVKNELEKLNDTLEALEEFDEEARIAGLTTFFSENNYKIIIPCLLAYGGPEGFYDDIENNVISEVNDLIAKLDSSSVDINFCDYEIMFIVLPVQDVEEVRAGVGIA